MPFILYQGFKKNTLITVSKKDSLSLEIFVQKLHILLITFVCNETKIPSNLHCGSRKELPVTVALWIWENSRHVLIIVKKKKIVILAFRITPWKSDPIYAVTVHAVENCFW